MSQATVETIHEEMKEFRAFVEQSFAEVGADLTTIKENQDWMMERLSEMGALQYQLNDYGKRINKLEMKVSRAKV